MPDVLVPVFLGVFAVFFVGVLAFIVASIVRSRRALQEAGLDPLAAQAQLAGRVANSSLLAPPTGVEGRLRELDDLRARRVITAEEYERARATALGIEPSGQEQHG